MVEFEAFEFETVGSEAMLTYDGTQSHREKRRTVTNNTNLAREVVENDNFVWSDQPDEYCWISAIWQGWSPCE